MQEDNLLYVLYGHCHQAYYILSVFTESGAISKKDLSKYYENIHLKSASKNHLEGPFDSLERIKFFILHVMSKMNLNCSYLLSSQDYNNALDEIQEKEEVINIFHSFAEKINLDKKVNQSRFFKRFREVFS